MAVCGIVCEYNPFHRGHLAQFQAIRQKLGADTAIVCIMSGDFVQRGEPAVFPKVLRARAAVTCGADLVLELPVGACLSSAEGFAQNAVQILDRLGGVDRLCFGCENGDLSVLQRVTDCLLSADFSPALRQELSGGLGFAAARQRAVDRLCGLGTILETPNNILAVEYCKALRRLDSGITPLPLTRPGDYGDTALTDPENPSATALRKLLRDGQEGWMAGVPEELHSLYRGQALYSLSAGERAVLARLRMLAPEDWQDVPHGGEGLENRVRREVMTQNTIEGVLQAAGTKRYPTARLRRLMLCACLGLTKEDLSLPAPYVRVLAFSNRGRAILRGSELPLLHVGEPGTEGRFRALEQRTAAFFALFCRDLTAADPRPEVQRVWYPADKIEK